MFERPRLLRILSFGYDDSSWIFCIVIEWIFLHLLTFSVFLERNDSFLTESAKPFDDSALSSNIVAIAVSSASAVVFAVVVLLYVVTRYKTAAAAATKRPYCDTVSLPVRKRVVLMRCNVLYSDDARDPKALTALLPQVKIEPCRTRLSSELTSMAEYEIPLDKEWEFTREK